MPNSNTSENQNQTMQTNLQGNECIEWYLVTRDGNGDIISESYVGNSCGNDEMPEGGDGGGNGLVGNDGGNPGNFGMDPNCLNCKILENNFDAFLNYLKGLNFQLSIPFQTTLTLGENTYHGTMIEVYDQNGTLVGSFFTPDVSSDLFTIGIRYSVGFRGSNGNGIEPPTYGYGIIGLTFPITYYNGRLGRGQMPVGFVRYTSAAQELINILGIHIKYLARRIYHKKNIHC